MARARVVYEVGYTDPFNIERAIIPVAAAFPANGAATGQVGVQVGFAPVSSNSNAADFGTPLPRFVSPADPQTAFNIGTCGPSSTVNIITNPPGLIFLVNSSPSMQTLHPQVGSTLLLSTVSPQFGPPGIRYLFQNWSDGGAISHPFTVPAQPSTVVANFTTQYQLTIRTVGSGRGFVEPQDGYFDANSLIGITGVPFPCSTFAGFSPEVVNGNLVLNSPKTLTATFNDDTAMVAGTLSPDGQSVTGQLSFAVTGDRRVTGTSRWRRTYDIVNHGPPLKRVALALDGPLTNVTGVFNASSFTSCARPFGSAYISLPDLATGAVASVTLEVTTIDPTQPWSGTLRVLSAGTP